MNLKDYLSYSKQLIKIIVKTIVLFIFFTQIIYSQENKHSEEVISNKDSIYVMSKSPWGAVLRSAILPGWGQIYNESYWKAPVVWGFAAYFIAIWIQNNNKYVTNRDLFIQSPEVNRFRLLRDFYRDQRDLFAIYLGITYFLNLVDAYVDAQLFDFTVEENSLTNQPMIAFRLKF